MRSFVWQRSPLANRANARFQHESAQSLGFRNLPVRRSFLILGDLRQSSRLRGFHSARKDSTGLIEAARLAGNTAASMAMINRADTDMQMETGSTLLV